MNPAGSILLADAHGLVRHGLQALINEVFPQWRGHLAGSLAETVQALQTLGRFDFVLLDLLSSDAHGMAGRGARPEQLSAQPATAVATAVTRATPAQVLVEVHGQRDGTHRNVAAVRQPVMKIGPDTLDMDFTPQLCAAPCSDAFGAALLQVQTTR